MADDAAGLLADLRGRGFELAAEGDRIRVTPAGYLSPDQHRAVGEHRAGLLALLRPDAAEAAALKAELTALEARDFPGGFPPVLRRCVGHYLAGPCLPPAEGAAA